MAEFSGSKTTVQSGASFENRNVRYVDDRIFTYAPSYAPILLLKGGIMPGPNGERIKVKGIIDSGFTPTKTVEWYEKDLLATDFYANPGSATLGTLKAAATISVDNGAGAVTTVPRVGDIIQIVTGNVTNGEAMLVNAITVGASSITLSVLRAINGVTGASISSNATFRVLNNALAENSTATSKRSSYATNYFNYMQIARDDWGVSRSDTRIRQYGGRDDYETMAEAVTNHCRNLEKSLTFGPCVSATDASGNVVQTSGGLQAYVPNVYAASSANCTGVFSGVTGHNGSINAITNFLETFCEGAFKYGNIKRKKIFLGGMIWGIIFNRAITGTSPATGSIRAVSKDTAFGVQITELVSAFGSIDFLPSGAINDFLPTDAYMIDPENLKFAYMDNTFMVDNSQLPDQDGYSGYFLTEYSLIVRGLKTHARISGVTTAA